MDSLLLRSIVAMGITAAATLVHAAECSAPAQLKAAQGNSVAQIFNAVFSAAPAKGIDCGSIASVWQKVVLREKTGGRKLEPDAPLDMHAARQQWSEALRNPDMAARLAAVQNNTSSPAEVAIYQAAILDEEGLYSARDARLTELAGGVNPLVK
jgi:hypothetical protein